MFSIPIEPVFAFILVLARVFFLFAFMPIYGEVFTPVRVRALLAVGVALVLTPIVEPRIGDMPVTLPGFVFLLIPEAMLGLAFGFVGRLYFAAIQFAGLVIGDQIGFRMANAMDPSLPAQIPSSGQLLYIVSILVFLGVDGDHYFFTVLARSFHDAPPGALSVSPRVLFEFFNQQAAEMFIVGTQLSLPFIAIFFAINVAMGIMNKAVPQMHVFIERFPIGILVGLFLLSMAANYFVAKMGEGLIEMRSDLNILVKLICGS